MSSSLGNIGTEEVIGQPQRDLWELIHQDHDRYYDEEIRNDAFENIDFETIWIEMPEEMNRAGHLFAKTEGKKGKKCNEGRNDKSPKNGKNDKNGKN